MTLEQFRSPELAALYTERYVERLVDDHAALFRQLIRIKQPKPEDPDTLALTYISPMIAMTGVCDRQPEKGSGMPGAEGCACAAVLPEFHPAVRGEKMKNEERWISP